jgi:DNA invertase Pin-like site-specific DNA recombinase
MKYVKYGYARISTGDQTTAMQIAALKGVRCSHIFEDKRTGVDIKRSALQRCLKQLRAGDTLVVWKLDRLARSLGHLITLLDDLHDRGVRFQSITESIDTETPAGRALWQMIGVMAEFERGLIIERTRAGMRAARARGVRPGRKPRLTPDQVRYAKDLHSRGEHPEKIAAILGGVSRATVYRAFHQ